MAGKYHLRFVGEEPEGSEASKPTEITQSKEPGSRDNS